MPNWTELVSGDLMWFGHVDFVGAVLEPKLSGSRTSRRVSGSCRPIRVLTTVNEL